LPKTYEEYLESLTKKNRHELRRKKRKFDNETTSYELGESKEQDIFDIFISQHRESKGEKGEFMTEVVETYFRNLLNLQGWKIYAWCCVISFISILC
jgi:predicted N-acyltransferase